MALRTMPNNIEAEKSVLGACFLSKYALEKASGSTFLEISKKQLSVIEILIPSNIEEQIAIGNFFKQLDDTLALQVKQLKALENLKKALLTKMFV